MLRFAWLCFVPIFAPLMSAQTLSKTTVEFDDTLQGKSSQKTVDLSGAGAGTVTLTPSPGFTATGCASVVGGNCTVSITFTPTALGAATGTLSVAVNGGTPLTVQLSGKGIAESLTTSGLGAQTPAGTTVNLQIQSNDSTSTRTLSLSSDDSKALWSSKTVTLSAGKAVVPLQFNTEGSRKVTITDTSGTPLPAIDVQTQVISSSTAALEGCSGCFAMIGAGAVLGSAGWEDYVTSSNILQTTHTGMSTPQLAAGLAYRLPYYGFGYNALRCDYRYYSDLPANGFKALCYPWKAFVSLKFSPDASQTFNGFTYGVSYSLHQYFDLMIGLSYSPYNEISSGFRQAAISVVTTQKAASNPYYAQWDPAALQASAGRPTAFDGFPTQLLKADGTVGPLIYTGNPLTLHYHSGFFAGISIPLKFKGSFLGN